MAKFIFDLDGTLIDSTSVFIPTIYATFSHFPNIKKPSEDMIRDAFGLTDEDFWKKLMPGSTMEERNSAYELRDIYIGKHMQNVNLLLPEAYRVLSGLYEQGHTLTTASNCGTAYLNSVLDSQSIRRFFTMPLCLEMVNGQEKADILRRHLEHFSKENMFMVGDRSSDIEAAHAVGIPAIGCRFGFGDKSELKDADYNIYSLTELFSFCGEKK